MQLQWMRRNLAMTAAWSFAIIIVLLAVIGAIRAFSVVPYWDMWGGTLGFYIAAALDGNSAAWWAQHNEHRIVLSRLLFWLDYALFGGTSVFLIIMNFVIVGLALLTFYRIVRQRMRDVSGGNQSADVTVWAAMAFLVAWLYHWMQWENLAWGFQSQFFLAQLLPLVALYLLSAARQADAAGRNRFVLACITGFACIGTMANGVIALPLMTVYALLTRFPWQRSLTLVLLTLFALSLYFYGYSSPGNHGSILETFLRQPDDLVYYVLLYLGTPFYFLTGGDVGMRFAAVGTAVMAALTVYALVKSLRSPTQNLLALALVFYIAYIAGTALGTGGGRLVFGVEQAATNRYTTPALMAWAALLVLFLPAVERAWRQYRPVALIAIVCLGAAMLWRQTLALQPQQQVVFNREVAALALELRVRDEQQINSVYVMDQGLFNTVAVASEYNIGIFDRFPWRDLAPQLGDIVRAGEAASCQGHIDQVSAIDGDTNYLRVDGWLFSNTEDSAPQLIQIRNPIGEISGFALTGQPRPDVAEAVDDDAGRSGFRGYIRREYSQPQMILSGVDVGCDLQVDIPATLLE